MPEELITVTGIEEACAFLDSAPKIIVSQAFLRALEAAAKVIEAEIWPRVPQDVEAALNQAHGGRGLLVANLDHWIEIDSQSRGGFVQIGFGPLGHIALWVEYGHSMTGHLPAKNPLGKPVPAKPFMRQAFAASVDRALEAFVEQVMQVIT
ncbi:MAG TPA: hypothetical protein VNH83_18915, partial [Bryobacteraceae bacterium]|nr:hypothetical protein [Bryobacteraceae bacterium]